EVRRIFIGHEAGIEFTCECRFECNRPGGRNRSLAWLENESCDTHRRDNECRERCGAGQVFQGHGTLKSRTQDLRPGAVTSYCWSEDILSRRCTPERRRANRIAHPISPAA